MTIRAAIRVCGTPEDRLWTRRGLRSHRRTDYMEHMFDGAATRRIYRSVPPRRRTGSVRWIQRASSRPVSRVRASHTRSGSVPAPSASAAVAPSSARWRSVT
ncbi:hypothetical protein HMPREF1317_0691 [Schaalia georgiae F0490]|uniref:Uncharacterized protein n=1 Tax=Schaalia georgiae F0490 TaxID=1125717 RepID=J0NW88_9ACTO|nr:hypothetical protein HMPREF1317_0691 [Schaalia georgiae F0490]